MQTERKKHVGNGGHYNSVVPVIEVFSEPGNPRFKREETEWRPHDPSYGLNNPGDNKIVNQIIEVSVE